jgi:hypothetical protein
MKPEFNKTECALRKEEWKFNEMGWILYDKEWKFNKMKQTLQHTGPKR